MIQLVKKFLIIQINGMLSMKEESFKNKIIIRGKN